MNFIVSNLRDLWLQTASEAFILDPYILSEVEKDGVLKRYSNVVIASIERRTTDSIESDNDYINDKHRKYTEILAGRLNDIHNARYNLKFWRKAFSFGLTRYLTLSHQLFSVCEKYFDTNKHACNILSPDSYVISYDFEEVRNFLQYTDFGQEQLFSIYMRTFYPGLAHEICAEYIPNITANNDKPESGSKRRLSRLLNKVCRLSLNRAVIKIISNLKSKSELQIGLLGAYFSPKYKEKLIIKSGGKINVIPYENVALRQNLNVDNILRNNLFWGEKDFDRFDQFIFHGLRYFFPQALLEDFSENVRAIEKNFSCFASLKYLVSESWLSSTGHSLALALMRTKGVRHIYNEHNCLFYPWAGSMTSQQAELSDIFYTLGWYDPSMPNIVRGASLFEFKIKKPKDKKFKAVLFSNVALVRMPQYSSHYAFCGPFIPDYVEYMKLFYAALSQSVKGKIIYRGPKSQHRSLLCYDKKYLLRPHLEQLNLEDTSAYTGREVIARSRLIIVDYLSTTHLESLKMDVPTIILLNPAINLLKDKYSHFFDILIDAGICQTDPVKAAKFIEMIIDDPEAWWFSAETQKAKNDFLDQNFGKPATAINYYLGLLE